MKFSLLILILGCEDFLSGPLLDQNPNEVDDVSVVSPEALLVGSQVTIYGVMEGYLNRAVSMVMQQMSGLQTDYYRDYNCDPIDVNTNGRWTAMYGTGGLIDLNTTQEVANAQEKYVLLAISQMWEALLFSTAADLWGDIPPPPPGMEDDDPWDDGEDVNTGGVPVAGYLEVDMSEDDYSDEGWKTVRKIQQEIRQ